MDKHPLTVPDRPIESETCIIAVLGASYRQDVGNARYSGSELIARKLTALGGQKQCSLPFGTVNI